MMIRKVIPITVVLMLLVVGVMAPAWAQRDSRYQRNGEVYLLIGKESTVPGVGTIDYRGVWRLNDPEGIFSGVFPQFLIGEVDILDLAVDLNRYIFTLSDPAKTPIGAGYKLKRQVIDDQTLDSDRGCHNWIHSDHRNKYWGQGTNVYRTGPVGRGIKRSGNNIWPGFVSAGPGDPTSPPESPSDYLPTYSDPKLQLPHYPGRNWYEIPNYAWFSSWRYIKGCGWFYQVFSDRATGTQFDWKLIPWKPNAAATTYAKQPGNQFATTYAMSIQRATLAGCLDGCGGASGNETISTGEMVFSPAFMPTVDGSGNPVSRTYFYTRPVGKTNYTISTTGPGATNYILKGHATGYDVVPDTQWLGVSIKNNTSDYLYCLGNSVIKNWITAGGGNATGVKISAVAVSNQWFQRGGIVFAYDSNEKMVYRFDRNEDGGAHVNTAFPITSILSQIGAAATSQIEDIKADGYGNLFIGLTFPTTNIAAHNPTTNWTMDNAYLFETAGEINDEGMQEGKFFFRQDYRKSVWRLSALGEPPREEGQRIFATRIFYRNVAMPTSGWAEVASAGALPLSGMSSLIASWTNLALFPDAVVGPFVLHEASMGTDPGQCRLAVINVPTPPEVLSLGAQKSYLDIIGAYKDAIPIYDPTNRSTRQDSATRFSGNLDVRQLYFYMVENYPLPTGAQNPTVKPDYDGDGRHGGFVSTIKDPHPSTDTTSPGTIRYYWRTWLVEDQYGNPICPPEPLSDPGASSFFHWFYTPIKGKFIITCRVDYDWWNFDKVPYGVLYNPFIANPGEGSVVNTKAIPSVDGIVHELSSSRLTAIMGTGPFAFMASTTAMADTYRNTILGSGDNRDFYALQTVVVDPGFVPPPPDPVEAARVQRCDVAGNLPTTAANWYPQTAGQVNPPGGFHGVQAGRQYHWRMDVASQSVFFQPLIGANYTFIANKLTDSNQPLYFVNGNDEFRFNKMNPAPTTVDSANLRWAPNSEVAIEAYLRYPVPPISGGQPTIVQVDLGSNKTVVAAQNFAYFTTDGNLPPTDPYEAELVIEMSRLFLYDMLIYHMPTSGPERLLGKVPNLPKKVTVTAKTKVLIVDNVAPAISFDRTAPNQLFGLTGRTLVAGTNGNPTTITFRVQDNNPWDGLNGISPHASWASGNQTDNNTTITKYGTAGSAQFNLKPVFNQNNRGVRLSYEISSLTPAHRVIIAKHTAMPSFGSLGSGLSNPTLSYLIDTNNKVYRSHLDFSIPLSALSGGSALPIPKFYANNTPGYYTPPPADLPNPYKFFLSAKDSSGNELLEQTLNLVLQVRDDVPPEPYGTAQEFKGNTTARFPGGTGLPNTDAYVSTFQNTTTFNPNFISRGDWLPTAPGANRDGEIWDGGAFTNLLSLWSLGNTTVALPNNMRGVAITPGNLQVEDNVEVLLRVGVSDNAGNAAASMTFRAFNISGVEEVRTTGNSTFSSAGMTTNASASVQTSARTIFREGRDAANVAVRFPLAVPISITAVDDARDWDRYSSCNVTADGGNFSWGANIKGSANPNRRTFRTTLPVYGSELLIRTIERGLRNP
jgi:hypothetical protein